VTQRMTGKVAGTRLGMIPIVHLLGPCTRLFSSTGSDDGDHLLIGEDLTVLVDDEAVLVEEVGHPSWEVMDVELRNDVEGEAPPGRGLPDVEEVLVTLDEPERVRVQLLHTLLHAVVVGAH